MASGTLREFRVEQDVEYFGYEEKEELWLLGKSASGACTYRPQSVHDGRELSARGGGRFLSNGRSVWIESVPMIVKKRIFARINSYGRSFLILKAQETINLD